jgi:transposase
MDAKEKRHRILFLGHLGVKSATIAELLQVNIKTVEKWRSRGNAMAQPKMCEPRVLTMAMKASITELCRDRWNVSTRKVAKIITSATNNQVNGTTISKSSVSRFLRSTDWGRVAYKAQTATMLTSKNVLDRLTFCTTIHFLGYCDLNPQSQALVEHILFTDESIIELFPSPNSQNTRIRTSSRELLAPLPIPKNGLKIMVAGGMCARGLTELHIVDQGQTVNGDYYRTRILPCYLEACSRTVYDARIDQRLLFTSREAVVFMQDGAPAHTANATLELIGQRFGSVWSRGIWPGNSPDLNPIEHIWPILKDAVFIEPRPRNRESLVQRVQETWSSLSETLLQKLAYSFPSRIEACLKNSGGRTKY